MVTMLALLLFRSSASPFRHVRAARSLVCLSYALKQMRQTTRETERAERERWPKFLMR